MGAMLDAPWAGSAFAPPTPTDIATIEAAIVAQLRAQISSIEIAHYPAEPETWRLTHRVGAALVIYKGAQYGDLLDTAAVIQVRNHRKCSRRADRISDRRMPQDASSARKISKARQARRRLDLRIDLRSNHD